jgi:hypothetical protein
MPVFHFIVHYLVVLIWRQWRLTLFVKSIIDFCPTFCIFHLKIRNRVDRANSSPLCATVQAFVKIEDAFFASIFQNFYSIEPRARETNLISLEVCFTTQIRSRPKEFHALIEPGTETLKPSGRIQPCRPSTNHRWHPTFGSCYLNTASFVHYTNECIKNDATLTKWIYKRTKCTNRNTKQIRMKLTKSGTVLSAAFPNIYRTNIWPWRFSFSQMNRSSTSSQNMDATNLNWCFCLKMITYLTYIMCQEFQFCQAIYICL